MKKLVLVVFAGAVGLMAQTPTIASVINTESPTQTQSAPLCPGILATIYGTGFGSSASAVTVSVGNQPAWVNNGPGGVIPKQIDIQIPYDVPAGQAFVVVTVGGVSATPFSITLQTAAPTLPLASGTPYGIFANLKGAFLSSSTLANPGDTVSLYATGLGATNPVIAVGPASKAASTATQPTLTVGGVAATVLFAGLSPGLAGLYQINFTVPTTVQGNVPVVVSIDGQTSNSATLPLTGISAIVNGGSFLSTGTVAPGEYVSLFANGLGSKDQLYSFPATTVQGISVTFNGIAAPIADLVTEQGQINLIVPSELPATGTVQVQLTTPTGTSSNYPIIMNAAVPGVFLINDPSNAKADIAAAQFASTVWLVVPTSAATALGIAQNCTASMANPLSACGQPASPGDTVEVYVTGLGEATPKGDPNGTPLATGVVAPADGSVLYETIATPTVQLGGMPVKVLFSGITPGTSGEYQIDFTVPTGVTEGDSVPLTVSMPGSTTATATMAIHSS